MNLESRIQHERLTRMCFIDYDRQMAMVAEIPGSGEEPGRIVGVGRIVRDSSRTEADLAVLVSDAFQRRGIGTPLVRKLIDFARDEKLRLLTASVLSDNQPMQTLLERHGFRFGDDSGSLLDGVREGGLVLE